MDANTASKLALNLLTKGQRQYSTSMTDRNAIRLFKDTYQLPDGFLVSRASYHGWSYQSFALSLTEQDSHVCAGLPVP